MSLILVLARAPEVDENEPPFFSLPDTIFWQGGEDITEPTVITPVISTRIVDEK